MTFGKILKELRRSHQFTQEKLASLLGVANSTISMYERGERFPDYEMMKVIANLFNVDINYLYGYQKRTPSLLDLVSANPIDVDLQLFAESPEKEKAPLESLLTPEGIQVAIAFHNARPEIQFAIKTMLGIDTAEPHSKTDIV